MSIRYLIVSLSITSILAPFPIMASLTASRYFKIGEWEPLFDQYILYYGLFPVFTAAAMAVVASAMLFGLFRVKYAPAWVLGLICALGAGLWMTALDAVDSYFSPEGIGWVWPLGGAVLGFGYGLVYQFVWLRFRP